jgi:ATP-dependent DNA helicase PIF1
VPGRNARGEQIPATFAFEAESWDDCVGSPITLTKVFRQKDQGRFRYRCWFEPYSYCVAFVDMLNAIRFGKTSSGTIQAFKRLSRPVIYTDGIDPMEL